MRYAKTNFSCDPEEQARIVSFSEDCAVSRHYNQLQVSTSSAHPAQHRLTEATFGKYGHVARTSTFNETQLQYQWQSWVLLNHTFDFILDYKKHRLKFLREIAGNGYEFVRIASLTDTEGWVGISNHLNVYQQANLTIANSDRPLLAWTRKTLGGTLYRSNRVYLLHLARKEAIEALLKLSLCHEERVAAKELILRHHNNGGIRLPALREYKALRRKIDEEVQLCSMQARLDWITRHGRPHPLDPDQTIPRDSTLSPSLYLSNLNLPLL